LSAVAVTTPQMSTAVQLLVWLDNVYINVLYNRGFERVHFISEFHVLFRFIGTPVPT